jgi:hypothetical protein
MKYKITVEAVEEYPEMETVYESKEGGTRYYSRWHKDIEEKKVKVEEKQYPTGKMLQRTTAVYTQEFEAGSLVDVIKAVNLL